MSIVGNSISRIESNLCKVEMSIHSRFIAYTVLCCICINSNKSCRLLYIKVLVEFLNISVDLC